MSQELIEAIKSEEFKTADKLVKAGTDLNITDDNGCTPLVMVLQYLLDNRVEKWHSEGHNGSRFVEYRIDHGLFTYHVEKKKSSFSLTDQKFCAKKEWSPDGLHLYYDGIDLALKLIKSEADLNATDEQKNTPFLLACRLGETRIIRALLDAGADLRAVNSMGMCALHMAAGSQRVDGFNALLRGDKDVDLNAADNAGWTAFHHAACFADSTEIITVLQEKKADHGLKSTAERDGFSAGTSASDIAKDKGHTDILILLSDEEREYSDLEIRQAAHQGNITLVKKFLESGGDVELTHENGYTLLLLASYGDQPDMVELLLKNGANVNTMDSDNVNALIMCLSRLCDKGPRIPAFDSEYMDHVRMAELLIDHGIDLSVIKRGGEQAALRYAADSSTEVTKMICNKLKSSYKNCKELVNLQDTEGFTALHAAARSGDIERISAIVDAGANLNLAEDYGFIPLHEAIIAGKTDAVKYLLDHGADVNHTISRGYDSFSRGDNAKAIAEKAGKKEIIDLF